MTTIPLPEPTVRSAVWGEHITKVELFTADQMRSYAAQVRREALEELARKFYRDPGILAGYEIADAIRALIKEEV